MGTLNKSLDFIKLQPEVADWKGHWKLDGCPPINVKHCKTVCAGHKIRNKNELI